MHTCYRYRYIAKDGDDVLLHGLLTSDGPSYNGDTMCCRDTRMYSSSRWARKLELYRVDLYPKVKEGVGKWSIENRLTSGVGGFHPHDLPNVVGQTHEGEVQFIPPSIKCVEEYTYNVIVTFLEKREKCKASLKSSESGITCKRLSQKSINSKAKKTERRDQEKSEKENLTEAKEEGNGGKGGEGEREERGERE